jgi:hypothetical protein
MRSSPRCPPWPLHRCPESPDNRRRSPTATNSETLGTSPAQLRFEHDAEFRRRYGPEFFPAHTLFPFSVLMRFPQAHPGTTAICIDEIDAGSLQSAPNCHVVRRVH